TLPRHRNLPQRRQGAGAVVSRRISGRPALSQGPHPARRRNAALLLAHSRRRAAAVWQLSLPSRTRPHARQHTRRVKLRASRSRRFQPPHQKGYDPHRRAHTRPRSPRYGIHQCHAKNSRCHEPLHLRENPSTRVAQHRVETDRAHQLLPRKPQRPSHSAADHHRSGRDRHPHHRAHPVIAHTRRDFLALAASAAAALPLRALAQAPAEKIGGTLTIDPAVSGPTLPVDYTCFSYEAAQLANPAFFSAANKALIGLFRELTPHGVLRIGGGSSEFTTYSATASNTPPPFETFGPDTSKTTKSGTITTAPALGNLRAFLDATGWTCLYGLNLCQGTKENAATEAEAVHRILGPRLAAFQIGNEPDSFRNRYRPASYTPEDFIHEWLDFHAAIVARVPNARF